MAIRHPDGYTRTLILSDIHAPYEDPAALSVALQLCRWLRPHTLILAGDILDCYACSRFAKDPARATGKALQAELSRTTQIIHDLRIAAGSATDIIYLAGNHEDRIAKTLLTKAGELYGLDALEVHALLHLDAYRVQYIDSHTLYRHHGMIIEHGQVIRSRSGYSAKGQLDKRGVSGISGHTHRLGVIHHTDMAGSTVWAENGCLCALDPEYLVGTPDWQQGCSVLWRHPESGHTALDQVAITDGTALYAGQAFCA
jgi:predicted phosphodiesterase